MRMERYTAFILLTPLYDRSGTRADWRAHLKLAKNELGMVGIRGHGLLDDGELRANPLS